MAYTIISQNNSTTTLSDGVNTITVPSRVNLTSGNFTIVEVNNNMATLEDGDGNVYRDIPCVATLAGEGGGGGSGLPDQTGNAGKFLTTDGTDASWSDKPLVNKATDTTSLAIGGTIGARNVRSVVIGQNANATANWATVIGAMATSRAADTVSIGYGAIQGGGQYSIGIGEFGSTVSGGINAQRSIAIVPQIASVSQLTAHDTIVLGAVYSFSGLKDNTFYVGLGLANGQTYELLSSDGTIPTARLTKVNSTITLTAAGWSGGSQTVTVNGVTATGVVLVSPDPTDQSAYTSAGIICTTQAANSLTFTCSTTPTADIDVNVVML